ncbi:hypothetical protein ACIQ9Q_40840 [Streptomyces sp. NPDC094438]|uniref:hypothetical protein n=1 Tax=Streptomyces sp. NPDC094438 TaxID=3366061 RepID=UPI00382B3A02
MSVLTAIHIPLVGHAPARNRGAVRARFAHIWHRLADSPLDSTVLRALPGPAIARTPPERARHAGPHAHWHTVAGPDGRRHLEATWH